LWRYSGTVTDSQSVFLDSQNRIWEEIPMVLTSLHKSDLQQIDNMKRLQKGERIQPKF